MRVFYRGFNLYGQFPSRPFVVENFTEQILDNLTYIEISHSFNTLQFGSDVYYFGAKNDIRGHKEKLDTLNLINNIKQISCTDDKILFLGETGKLFKTNIVNYYLIREVPKFASDYEKIVKISCGAKIIVALTENGNFYNIPEKLSFSNRNIIDVKTGREHCLILENNGNVYSFGRGSRGQLGHSTLEDEEEPRLIEALAGIKIKHISCGGWHSVALSEEGDLYVWGWNGNGQLGLAVNSTSSVHDNNVNLETSNATPRGDTSEETPTVSVLATPQPLEFNDPQTNVCKVACGNRHTILLLGDKKLYGCGWNKYKQLLNTDKENINKITYIHDFFEAEVIDLKCGPWSSVVLCS